MITRLACLISRDREHNFRAGNEITNEEFEQIKRLLTPIKALENEYSIKSVVNSWNAFTASISLCSEGPASYDRSLEVASKMSAWLSAFSSYIDHEETFWKRNFPEWAEAYLKATREEFDREHRSYALTIKMRHYALHADISGISISLGGLPNEKEPSVTLRGNRDTLLEKNKGHWGAPVDKFLREQSEEFELLPYFVEGMNSLFRIRAHSLNLLLLKCRESIAPLRNWINKALANESDSNAMAVILILNDDCFEKPANNSLTFNHTVLPHKFFLNAIERANLNFSNPLEALNHELQDCGFAKILFI